MYDFLAGLNAPWTPPQQQHKQPQAASSAPPPVCDHQMTASPVLDGKIIHDSSLLLRIAAQCCKPSITYSSCDEESLTEAVKQERANISDLYSTIPRPVALPSSSAVHRLDGIRQQPAKQPHQHPYTSTLHSHEHAANTITPVPGLSLALPQHHQQSSFAVILSEESLRGHFDDPPYSTFRRAEVSAIPSKPESSRQHCGSASQLCHYHTSSAGCSRHLPRAPASLQQHQQQRLPVNSSIWAAATATAIKPSSPFAPPSIQSLTASIPPGYSYCVSGSAVPAPPATVPAPSVPSAALPTSNQSQTTQSVVSKPPPSGQTCASTARPSTHSIVIGRPTLSRGRAAMLQPATSTVHTRPHCLTGANATEFVGKTYYFEAVSRGGSIGNNSGHAYPSVITTASRPPPPAVLQQHYLQPARQQQWPVEQQPVYSRLIAHNGKINHFATHTATPGGATQPPPTIMSGVAPLTSVSSSATGGERSGTLPQSHTVDMNNYIGQGSWHQLQQHQNTHQTSAVVPDTDARGIARRNRGRAVLFVGQLNYEATEADVSQVFSCYGKPLSVVVLKDKGKTAKKVGAISGVAAAHRKVGGTAFVTYGTTLEADTAIMALHGRYNAKGDDAESVDESKYLQVSYGQQTGLISAFGMMHAEKLHTLKPENPIPFLVKNSAKGKS